MNLVEMIISTIAPHRCLVCGVNGQVLCEACRLTALATPPARCYRCHGVTAQSQVCHNCRKTTALKHVWVASDYQDAAKELLRRLKFDRASAAAKPVAAAVDAVLPDLPADIVVVHIPTANNRVRQRGYDQAELIAKNLAKKRGWKQSNLLMRRGYSRQLGAGRSDRFAQVEFSLVAIKPNKIKNAHILLVDDVTTTGATLEAAAKILKKAGAKTVDAAVFAQPI